MNREICEQVNLFSMIFRLDRISVLLLPEDVNT